MGEMMVAVGAVIRDDAGRVLLVRHVPERSGFWQGRWICPGGRLEVGESLAEGVLREVAEETGLQIELQEQLPPFERIVRSNGDTSLHVVYIDFLARLVGGEFHPDSDVGEGIWVSREQLDGIWDELHEDTIKLLELAQVIRSEH